MQPGWKEHSESDPIRSAEKRKRPTGLPPTRQEERRRGVWQRATLALLGSFENACRNSNGTNPSLREELKIKNEQIKESNDRARETNVLTRDLHGLMRDLQQRLLPAPKESPPARENVVSEEPRERQRARAVQDTVILETTEPAVAESRTVVRKEAVSTRDEVIAGRTVRESSKGTPRVQMEEAAAANGKSKCKPERRTEETPSKKKASTKKRTHRLLQEPAEEGRGEARQELGTKDPRDFLSIPSALLSPLEYERSPSRLRAPRLHPGKHCVLWNFDARSSETIPPFSTSSVKCQHSRSSR